MTWQSGKWYLKKASFSFINAIWPSFYFYLDVKWGHTNKILYRNWTTESLLMFKEAIYSWVRNFGFTSAFLRWLILLVNLLFSSKKLLNFGNFKEFSRIRIILSESSLFVFSTQDFTIRMVLSFFSMAATNSSLASWIKKISRSNFWIACKVF